MTIKPDVKSGGFAVYGNFNGRSLVASGETRVAAMKNYIDLIRDVINKSISGKTRWADEQHY